MPITATISVAQVVLEAMVPTAGGVSPISISCGSSPTGNVGAPFSDTFPVTGGTAPYSFAIIAGAIPPGTSLNTSTGVISGVPTLAGPFTFTIQVTDSTLASDAVVCSIVIQYPVTPSVPANPGGGPPELRGPGGGCALPKNIWDLCAEQEVYRTRRIRFAPPCNIPAPLLPWDEDYMPVPAGGVPFNVQGSIATPATAAGDVLVCSARVPTGYDALLTEIYCNYLGAGFAQGSGDIVWRVRRNQVWLKQLGQLLYALGNPRTGVQLTQGEIIFSGSQFSFFANVPNLSGMIQIGTSRIICGMRGFYWPRG